MNLKDYHAVYYEVLYHIIDPDTERSFCNDFAAASVLYSLEDIVINRHLPICKECFSLSGKELQDLINYHYIIRKLKEK